MKYLACFIGFFLPLFAVAAQTPGGSLVSVATAIRSSAVLPSAHETVLHSFQANPAINPEASLISDSAGNLYGTSGIGGNDCPPVCGTVFELSPTATGWNFRAIYRFKGGSDGQNPQGGLLLDAAGNLYGTTEYGGTTSCFGQTYGCGTVFKLTRSSGGHWTESVLYRFDDGSGGGFPLGNLAVDAAGNLYGAASAGGSTACNPPFGCGTIYELSPGATGWTESVLYSFTGAGDGWQPGGNLAFDAAGNLYGGTGRGGSSACANGCGVIFELTPGSGGWTFGVAYSFTGGSDGAFPYSGVVLDGQGNIYGTAGGDGSAACPFGCGTVFELTPSGGGWIFNLLHSFDGSDGEYPNAVVLDSKGNLYGTTSDGGGNGTSNCSLGCGTVYKLAPGSGGWTDTVLYRFSGGNDGGQPLAGVLVNAASDKLFGTTYDGGTADFGVVFELTASH